MRSTLYNILLIIGLSILLTGAVYCGFYVHKLSAEKRAIKEDYSLVNSITFGLFSVDEWRDRISDVINGQVNGYSITPEQKKQIQAAVEKELHALVAKTIAEIDKPQKTILGKVKKAAFHVLADSDSLQAQVKPFATTIVQKVTSPASQARLKSVAKSKIGQMEAQTYDNTSEADEKVTKNLFQKYHVAALEDFNATVHKQLEVKWRLLVKYAIGMLACALAALLLWLVLRRRVHLQNTLFVMALLFAGVLLVVGLTTSIIDVDARMQSVDFMMLGQKVSFQNQVLFFQSKSIWGIITTLLAQQKPDAVTVGVLILLFVVILPVVRLVAKGLHIAFNKTLGNNKVINYLAFEAGKWDIADVMIVGVLMTYIGLNGILRSELGNLNIHNDVFTSSTVNYTSLEAGYFIFTGYVIFEMLLSYILKRITPKKVK
jgi:hypothetical protein